MEGAVVVERCMACKQMVHWFGNWKVLGEGFMAFLYTPVSIRKAESKGLPDPRLQNVNPGVSCSPRSYMICTGT